MKNTILIWSSDNTAANVTEDGRVFGEEVGTAIISVSTKDGQYSDTCKIQVTNGKGFRDGNGKAKGHLK